MKDGFIKVACVSPLIFGADVETNVGEIIKYVNVAKRENINVMVFPELSITSRACGDLFTYTTLLSGALNGLSAIIKSSLWNECLFFVGMPFVDGDKIYNVAVAICNGEILGIVPKSYFNKDSVFSQKRQFYSGYGVSKTVEILGKNVPFGTDLVFCSGDKKSLRIGVQIAEDIYAVDDSAIKSISGGNATVIAHLNGEDETIDGVDNRINVLKTKSTIYKCAYLSALSGVSETSSGSISVGHNLIVENGVVLAESQPFGCGKVSSEVDVDLLCALRKKSWGTRIEKAVEITFSQPINDCLVMRKFEKQPFVPTQKKEETLEYVLKMQAHAIKKRVLSAYAKCLVIGISGGLDSALALLSAVRARDLMSAEKRAQFRILGITMPCFGTTERTLNNARLLTSSLGVECKKISIRTAVNRHLSDIKHQEKAFDVTYENAQARERTQVLMDVANMNNGLVLGTGDLSEIALGWSTYNGDHMSMYNVNSSLPKTLIKSLVRYEADRLKGGVAKALNDILDTPISPELLPSNGVDIKQVTEDKVGPYVLHDFFLYHFIKNGFSPAKIYRIAKDTFIDEYDKDVIKKWLREFFRRFFTQQFKRACAPDGIKILSINLSAKGGWEMPSDAVWNLWQKEIDNLE